MTSERDPLRSIEELRLELHRRMGGQYDPSRVAQLVNISQELDKLVVEVTRQQWPGPCYSVRHGDGEVRENRPRRKRR